MGSTTRSRLMIRRLVRTIWHGTWINATQNVLNSIRSSDRFSARYFSAHRPRSGSIRALLAFRLHASAAITIYVAVHRWNVVPLMPSLYDGSP